MNLFFEINFVNRIIELFTTANQIQEEIFSQKNVVLAVSEKNMHFLIEHFI